MTSAKMHPDEISINASLVDRLIALQFPQWADLPLKRIESAGTDNAIFRLGKDMAVRLPRIPKPPVQVEKEQKWLPKLAPHLPLVIPTPLAIGTPTRDYPCTWSVYSWIDGKNATPDNISDSKAAAIALGQFVTALQKIDPTGGPKAGEHNFFRGVPLKILDKEVRPSFESLKGIIEVNTATEMWEKALEVREWNEEPRWIHGDLHSGNLLAREGRLVAVIDFGGLGIGDPACDMMPAWCYLDSETRKAFREEVSVDEDTWARGRGWALYFGLVALPYYLRSNPVLAKIARYAIEEVLAEAP